MKSISVKGIFISMGNRWLRDNKHLDIWWSVDGNKDRCKNIDDDIDQAIASEPKKGE